MLKPKRSARSRRGTSRGGLMSKPSKKQRGISQLERELRPVLHPEGRLTEIQTLLSQLNVHDRPVVVTTYPACNAGEGNAGME